MSRDSISIYLRSNGTISDLKVEIFIKQLVGLSQLKELKNVKYTICIKIRETQLCFKQTYNLI